MFYPGHRHGITTSYRSQPSAAAQYSHTRRVSADWPGGVQQCARGQGAREVSYAGAGAVHYACSGVDGPSQSPISWHLLQYADQHQQNQQQQSLSQSREMLQGGMAGSRGRTSSADSYMGGHMGSPGSLPYSQNMKGGGAELASNMTLHPHRETYEVSLKDAQLAASRPNAAQNNPPRSTFMFGQNEERPQAVRSHSHVYERERRCSPEKSSQQIARPPFFLGNASASSGTCSGLGKDVPALQIPGEVSECVVSRAGDGLSMSQLALHKMGNELDSEVYETAADTTQSPYPSFTAHRGVAEQPCPGTPRVLDITPTSTSHATTPARLNTAIRTGAATEPSEAQSPASTPSSKSNGVSDLLVPQPMHFRTTTRTDPLTG